MAADVIPEGETRWWKLPPAAQSTLGWACHQQRIVVVLRWAKQRPQMLHADMMRHLNEIAAENRTITKLMRSPRQATLL